MTLTVSEVFGIEPNGDVEELISTFNKMVRWWVEKAGSMTWSRSDHLRAAFYKDWTTEFRGWCSQLAHTSALEAFARAGMNRPPRERAAAVEIDLPIAVLHPQMMRIENGCLRIYAGRETGHIYVKLKPVGKMQETLLMQAERRLWKIGQVTLSKRWVVIPFIMDNAGSIMLKIIDELLKNAGLT